MEENLEAITNPTNWQIVGPQGKAIPITTPQAPGHSTLSKKRTISTSILTKALWKLLRFLNTPTGEKHLKLWPIIYTQCRGSKRYMSLLNVELQGTRISLPTGEIQSNESLRENFWSQMQSDLEINVGLGSRYLAHHHWNTIEWINNWQKLEDRSHICHVIALIEYTAEDDLFFIEESTHQWTIAEDLNIWTSSDWAMEVDACFFL